MAKPNPDGLEILININMNIARGLNEQTQRRMEAQENADPSAPPPPAADV